MGTKSITEFPDAPDIESSTWGYAGRFSGDVGQWLLGQQVEATSEAISGYFSDQKGLQVLDVGGGHGQNIDLIHRLGHSLTIVGSDLQCTEVIQSALDQGRAEFKVACLKDLPFEDDSFDLVICYRILSHMASWQQLVAELARVSKRVVLVDYPARRSINIVSDVLFAVKKRIEKNTRQYGCFWDSEIDQAFLAAGLRNSYRHRQFFLPMALYRLINRPAICKTMASVFRATGITGTLGSPVIAGYEVASP